MFFFYSWCRVSALINLTVTDYYERGGTRWLRFGVAIATGQLWNAFHNCPYGMGIVMEG